MFSRATPVFSLISSPISCWSMVNRIAMDSNSRALLTMSPRASSAFSSAVRRSVRFSATVLKSAAISLARSSTDSMSSRKSPPPARGLRSAARAARSALRARTSSASADSPVSRKFFSANRISARSVPRRSTSGFRPGSAWPPTVFFISLILPAMIRDARSRLLRAMSFCNWASRASIFNSTRLSKPVR